MLTERRSTGQKLLKVNLEFQPMQKCNSSLSEQADPVQLRQALRVGLLEDSMLCAGVLEGGRDSCQVSPDTGCSSRNPLFLPKLQIDQPLQQRAQRIG